MLYEALAVICGGLLGFAATWKFVTVGMKEKKLEDVEARRAKISTISEMVESKAVEPVLKPPSDLREFVDYLSEKYMLGEVTILTPEGLPIVSNSKTADEDAAIAPELLKVAKRLLNSSRILLSGEGGRIMVIQANPDIILHAKVARDVSGREMDRIQEEINTIMEGLL